MAHLSHIGVKRRSGRYPFGSGEVPYQHESWFLNRVGQLRKQGVSELEIAKTLGFTKTTELRNAITKANDTITQSRFASATNYYNAGMGYTEIGRKMGISESTVRSILKSARTKRIEAAEATKDAIRDTIDKTDGYVDIGAHVNLSLGISATKFNSAVAELQKEGYEKIKYPVKQAGTGLNTEMVVLAKPGTTFAEVVNNIDKVTRIGKYTDDGGLTYTPIKPPKNISSDRVLIRYNEEGGLDRDGLVELRRGVPDISLGDSRYAQVRIGVDGTHYMKGMAVYSDNIPKGYDIIYNTNKPKGTPKDKVFKEQEKTGDNPFGATIRQREYIGEDGKKHLSPINIINEEGDWSKWSKNLSSQFLSKQPVELAKRQLQISKQHKEEELRSILAIDNPTVRKKLLLSYADDCDASAVYLKAAKMPRQSTRVILPLTSLKSNEVYAPGYRDGERVVLVRHPHGGKFELPELIVNNKNPDGKKMLGTNAKDAIGINHEVANQLSGADFDGDHVLVLPNDRKEVKTDKAIPSLATFDPSTAYPAYPGMTKLTEKNYNRDMEMGKVSNLITDMTLKHASRDEMERAIKHSMVVIDALKHNLNYKQSYTDNDIGALKAKYQGGSTKGAATLISRAKGRTEVDERKQWFAKVYDPKAGSISGIDPRTGEKIYATTGRTYTKVSRIDPKTGRKVWVVPENKKRMEATLEPEGGSMVKEIKATQETHKMSAAKDAFELSSGHPMEAVYANYANSMKALANQARKEYITTKEIAYSPAAKKLYIDEVTSIKAKLNRAERNAPLEREAQRLTTVNVKKVRMANPDMDKDDIQKLSGRLLEQARAKVGAKKYRIELDEREWKAVQAGAISKTTLSKVLDNSNMDAIKRLATPRQYKIMTPANVAKAKNWLNRGYTLEEIAHELGCSPSTITNALAM